MTADQYIPVTDADTALRAVHGLIAARQGYKILLERMIAPYPQAHHFDQTKRNQMLTLLGRADTIWVLVLVYAESKFAPTRSANSARARRRATFGEHLTRATLARGLAITESNNETAVAERRHTVAAARLVEAGLSFGLFELGDQPDEKQQPVHGTSRLAQFVHALGDHAYWTMRPVFSVPEINQEKYRPDGMKEEAETFAGAPQMKRTESVEDICADDAVMGWLR